MITGYPEEEVEGSSSAVLPSDRAGYNPDEAFYMENEKPVEEVVDKKPGFLGSVKRDIAGGVLDYVEMGARAARAVPGGPETYNVDKDSFLQKAIDWSKDVKKDFDVEVRDDDNVIDSALRSVITSLVSSAPTIAAGAGIGSTFGPLGTFGGGVLGWGLGAGTTFGLAEFDSTLEEAKAGGVSEEEAIPYALINGIAEGGIEFLGDATMGGLSKLATAPAKVALKNGIKNAFKIYGKSLFKYQAMSSAVETGGEMATSAIQTETRRRMGLTEETALKAAKDTFGPAFVASLMFGGILQGSNIASNRQQVKALLSPTAHEKDRQAAANVVYKQFKGFDTRAAKMWKEYSDEAIKNKEPINLNMNYSDLTIKVKNLEETAEYSPEAKKMFDIFKDQKEAMEEIAREAGITPEEASEVIDGNEIPVNEEEPVDQRIPEEEPVDQRVPEEEPVEQRVPEEEPFVENLIGEGDDGTTLQDLIENEEGTVGQEEVPVGTQEPVLDENPTTTIPEEEVVPPAVDSEPVTQWEAVKQIANDPEQESHPAMQEAVSAAGSIANVRKAIENINNNKRLGKNQQKAIDILTSFDFNVQGQETSSESGFNIPNDIKSIEAEIDRVANDLDNNELTEEEYGVASAKLEVLRDRWTELTDGPSNEDQGGKPLFSKQDPAPQYRELETIETEILREFDILDDPSTSREAIDEAEARIDVLRQEYSNAEDAIDNGPRPSDERAQRIDNEGSQAPVGSERSEEGSRPLTQEETEAQREEANQQFGGNRGPDIAGGGREGAGGFILDNEDIVNVRLENLRSQTNPLQLNEQLNNTQQKIDSFVDPERPSEKSIAYIENLNVERSAIEARLNEILEEYDQASDETKRLHALGFAVSLGSSQHGAGQLILNDKTGEVEGRVPSDNPTIVQEGIKILGSYKKVVNAVNKAIEGKKLGVAQQEAVDTMLGHSDIDSIVSTYMSKAKSAPQKGLSVELLETELRTEFGDKFDTMLKNGVLTIVETKEDLKGIEGAEEIIGEDGIVAGYYKDGQIFLIANNIGKGNGYNIFMHEGVHKLLHADKGFKANRKRLLTKFKNLKQTKAIKLAYGVVPKDTDAEYVDEEAFAYFMQDDRNRNHGIFRSAITIVKQALSKFKIPFTKLNEKDIASLTIKKIEKNLTKKNKVKKSTKGKASKQDETGDDGSTFEDMLADANQEASRDDDGSTFEDILAGTNQEAGEGDDGSTFEDMLNNGEPQGVRSSPIAMSLEHINQVVAGTKTATTRSRKFKPGKYRMPDQTVINVDSATKAIPFSAIKDPEAYARAEGYKSIEDMVKNSGFKNVVAWINGKGTMYVHRISKDKVDTSKFNVKPLVKQTPAEIKKDSEAAKKKQEKTKPKTKTVDKAVIDEFKEAMKKPFAFLKKMQGKLGTSTKPINKEAIRIALDRKPVASEEKQKFIDDAIDVAKHGDRIFLYGRVNSEGTAARGYIAWTVEAAAQLGKPVFVYDVNRKAWFTFNKGTSGLKRTETNNEIIKERAKIKSENWKIYKKAIPKYRKANPVSGKDNRTNSDIIALINRDIKKGKMTKLDISYPAPLVKETESSFTPIGRPALAKADAHITSHELDSDQHQLASKELATILAETNIRMSEKNNNAATTEAMVNAAEKSGNYKGETVTTTIDENGTTTPVNDSYITSEEQDDILEKNTTEAIDYEREDFKARTGSSVATDEAIMMTQGYLSEVSDDEIDTDNVSRSAAESLKMAAIRDAVSEESLSGEVAEAVISEKDQEDMEYSDGAYEEIPVAIKSIRSIYYAIDKLLGMPKGLSKLKVAAYRKTNESKYDSAYNKMYDANIKLIKTIFEQITKAGRPEMLATSIGIEGINQVAKAKTQTFDSIKFRNAESQRDFIVQTLMRSAGKLDLTTISKQLAMSDSTFAEMREVPDFMLDLIDYQSRLSEEQRSNLINEDVVLNESTFRNAFYASDIGRIAKGLAKGIPNFSDKFGSVFAAIVGKPYATMRFLNTKIFEGIDTLIQLEPGAQTEKETQKEIKPIISKMRRRFRLGEEITDKEVLKVVLELHKAVRSNEFGLIPDLSTIYDPTLDSEGNSPQEGYDTEAEDKLVSKSATKVADKKPEAKPIELPYRTPEASRGVVFDVASKVISSFQELMTSAGFTNIDRLVNNKFFYGEKDSSSHGKKTSVERAEAKKEAQKALDVLYNAFFALPIETQQRIAKLLGSQAQLSEKLSAKERADKINKYKKSKKTSLFSIGTEIGIAFGKLDTGTSNLEQKEKTLVQLRAALKTLAQIDKDKQATAVKDEIRRSFAKMSNSESDVNRLLSLAYSGSGNLHKSIDPSFGKLSNTEQAMVLNEVMEALNFIPGAFTKEIFGHGDKSVIATEQRGTAIDDVMPKNSVGRESVTRNKNSASNLNPRTGEFQNFTFEDNIEAIDSIALRMGLGVEAREEHREALEKLDSLSEKVMDDDKRSKKIDDLERKLIAKLKVEVATQRLLQKKYHDKAALQTIATKFELSYEDVNSAYYEAGSSQTLFFTLVNNLKTKQQLDRAKAMSLENLQAHETMSGTLDNKLIEGLNETYGLELNSLNLNHQNSKYKGTKVERYINGALAAKAEYLAKGRKLADIERIMKNNSMKIDLVDLFELKTKKLDAFSQSLADTGVAIGQFVNKNKQKFYDGMAKAFNADLVVIYDNREIASKPWGDSVEDAPELSLKNRSKYIPATKDNKAKLVINLASMETHMPDVMNTAAFQNTFHNLFSDMVAHNITNTLSASQMSTLVKSISDIQKVKVSSMGDNRFKPENDTTTKPKLTPIAQEKLNREVIQELSRVRLNPIPLEDGASLSSMNETPVKVGSWKRQNKPSFDVMVRNELRAVEAESELRLRGINVLKTDKLGEATRRALSRLISEGIGDIAFYEELAKTREGRSVNGKLILEMLKSAEKLEVARMKGQGFYNNNDDTMKLFTADGLQQVYQVFASIIGGKEFVDRGKDYANMNSNETILYSMGGFYSMSDLEAQLDKGKEKVKDESNKIFNSDDGAKVAIMNKIEAIIAKALDWIKEHKPKGFIEDFLADQVSMELASLVNHGATLAIRKVQLNVIDKHKDTFNELPESSEFGPSLESLNDLLTARGRAPVDVNTPQGIARVLAAGFSEDVVRALQDYRKVANELQMKLKVIYPEMEMNPAHYGQVAKWYKKDAKSEDDSFTRIISNQLGDGTRTTKSIRSYRKVSSRLAQGEKYKTMDPGAMLTDYMGEAHKLLNTRKMMEQAIKRNKGKILFNPAEAKKQGLHEVNDEAFQTLVPKQGKGGQWKVYINENVAIDAHGREMQFTSETGANTYAESIDSADVEVRVEETKVIDQTLVGYSAFIINGKNKSQLKTFLTKEDAEAYAKTISNSTVTVQVEPRYEAAMKSSAAQMYFEKDLARMLNTIVSRDLFKEAALFGISGRHLLKVKNWSTMVEFAFSFFHVFTIGQEILSSEMVNRVQNAKGFGKILALNPLASLRSGLRDATDLKAIVDAVISDPTLAKDPALVKKVGELLKTDNPDINHLIKMFAAVGGIFVQDAGVRSHVHNYGEAKYLNQPAELVIKNGEAYVERGETSIADIAKNMAGSIKETHKSLTNKFPDSKVGNLIKSAEFAGLEVPTAWLMEKGIPKLKMAVWMKDYSKSLEQNKAQLASGQRTHASLAHDTMKFVEDRFGEVNWKSQWLNKSYKSGLIFLFRSFTWVTGSWKALSKAGVDVGKLGWYTLKGEEYHLTQKGLWGMTAIMSHVMTAGAISIMYNLTAGDEEVPDDEETDLWTKLIYPRISQHDAKGRIAIPSYITELDKILHHLGILGHNAEPHKLLYGRMNSLVLNSIEAISGEDWRGTEVRNSKHGIPAQTFETLWHIFGVAPITISSAIDNYKAKGFEPLSMVSSLAGFSRAPAHALNSSAVNVAYEIRRGTYSVTRSKESAYEMRIRFKAGYMYAHGNKEPLETLLKEGDISQETFEDTIASQPYIDGVKNPRYAGQLQSAIAGASLEGAIQVWAYMSAAEKKATRAQIIKKYTNVVKRKKRSPNEITRLYAEMLASKIY